MLQEIASLVILFDTVLGLVIAIRLLKLGKRTRGPERWLAAYLLVAWCFGSVLAGVIYSRWGDPSLALPRALEAPLHGVYLAAISFGHVFVYIFTQRVFYPASTLVRRAVAAAAIALALAWLAFGFTAGFAVAVINGPSYWIGAAVRLLATVWLAVESFRHATRLRRRISFGLADPILANRFLLWGVWAAAVSIAQLPDPIARVWYWAVTGDAVHFDPVAGEPMASMMIFTTAVLGTISACAMFLTFFPIAAYRRWLLRHSAA